MSIIVWSLPNYSIPAPQCYNYLRPDVNPILQALGDGGQGWGNFILYVLASSKIRNRLFGWLIDRLPCCSKSEMTEEITPKPGNGYARIPRPEILSQYSSINEGGERINYGTIGMEPTTLSNSDSDS